jgi:hypothetical protein
VIERRKKDILLRSNWNAVQLNGLNEGGAQQILRVYATQIQSMTAGPGLLAINHRRGLGDMMINTWHCLRGAPPGEAEKRAGHHGNV